eukprot:NODE_3641_length_2006_cov_3.524747.p1 GENE.NODE_3641_length_2006_cov_3.524747~~NODE_3641_length_2006_cov_3.524747.p1  ORF type:complete len:419 (-),score=122.18 NODE_3641_length_2006_cov_3.524747:280-1536(-)
MAKRRRARLRQRLPRLLFSELSSIRPWSAFEAEVLRQFGPKLMFGIEEVLCLEQKSAEHKDGTVAITALLLFPRKLILANVKLQQTNMTELQLKSRGSTNRRTVLQPAEAAAVEDTIAAGSSASSSSAAPAPSAAGAAAAGPAGEVSDLFEVIDEAALKLFSQALKPINTLVYGFQDIESQLSGAGEKQTEGDGTQVQRWQFDLCDLKRVHAEERSEFLQLEDLRGCMHRLPVSSALISSEVFCALQAGFRSSLNHGNHHDNIATWDELRSALRLERRRDARERRVGLLESPGDANTAGAGSRTVEVFEYERRMLQGEWKTPWYPTDREISWRWVDATSCKHPDLDSEMSREEIVASPTPPCRSGALFRATTDWVIDKPKGTDPDGWRYGFASNSSTWEARPGLLDSVRKRRWIRVYE